MMSIALIVEGHGEVNALPELVRRIVGESGRQARVLRPHRVPKSKMKAALAGAVVLQSRRVGDGGGVVVLVDSDSDDPIVLEKLLREWGRSTEGTVRYVVAVKEFEAWFLAALPSLRRHKSVASDAKYEGDPESPRDAKGRLALQMTEPYQETLHQVSFCAIASLEEMSLAPSFVRFKDAILEISDQSATSRP